MSFDFAAFGLRPVVAVSPGDNPAQPHGASPSAPTAQGGTSPLSVASSSGGTRRRGGALPSDTASPSGQEDASPSWAMGHAERKRLREGVHGAEHDGDDGEMPSDDECSLNDIPSDSCGELDGAAALVPCQTAARAAQTPTTTHAELQSVGAAAASALFQGGRISAADKDASSVLFWAFDLTDDSVNRIQHSFFVRHAIALAAAAWPATFRLRDAAYCSLHFGSSYNEKHFAVFEGANVRLSPKELLLLDHRRHLLMTFDALDETILPLLSRNMPLFALIGSVDVLHGFQPARLGLIRLLKARGDGGGSMRRPRPVGVAEHGAVSWVLDGGGGLAVDSVLVKHMRGAFAA